MRQIARCARSSCDVDLTSLRTRVPGHSASVRAMLYRSCFTKLLTEKGPAEAAVSQYAPARWDRGVARSVF